MSRHIIRAFAGMDERHILGADQIHCCLHIDSNVRISVLVNRQAGRRVLDEDLQHPDFEIT